MNCKDHHLAISTIKQSVRLRKLNRLSGDECETCRSPYSIEFERNWKTADVSMNGKEELKIEIT